MVPLHTELLWSFTSCFVLDKVENRETKKLALNKICHCFWCSVNMMGANCRLLIHHPCDRQPTLAAKCWLTTKMISDNGSFNRVIFSLKISISTASCFQWAVGSKERKKLAAVDNNKFEQLDKMIVSNAAMVWLDNSIITTWHDIISLFILIISLFLTQCSKQIELYLNWNICWIVFENTSVYDLPLFLV